MLAVLTGLLFSFLKFEINTFLISIFYKERLLENLYDWTIVF